ncbi:flagellar hook-length control protein FliK [Shewanella sp. A25]|nr:flagellar hook-length control protein FliK [Shewanella shenzhenensis]
MNLPMMSIAGANNAPQTKASVSTRPMEPNAKEEAFSWSMEEQDSYDSQALPQDDAAKGAQANSEITEALQDSLWQPVLTDANSDAEGELLGAYAPEQTGELALGESLSLELLAQWTNDTSSDVASQGHSANSQAPMNATAMPLTAMQNPLHPEFLMVTPQGATQALAGQMSAADKSVAGFDTAALLAASTLAASSTSAASNVAASTATDAEPVSVTNNGLQVTMPLSAALVGTMRPQLSPTPAAELTVTDTNMVTANAPMPVASQGTTTRADVQTIVLQLNQAQGSAEMGQQIVGALKEKIQFQLGHQQQVAQIRLDPPKLGSIDIRIVIEGDRTVVQIHPSQGVVREAMQQTIEQLRTTLAGKLDTQVEVQLSSGDQQDSSKQQWQAMVADEEILANSQFEPADAATRKTNASHWIDRLA